MSSKRHRATSQASLSTSSSPEPTPKAARTVLPSNTSSSSPLLCTLPPTCNPPHRPTPLASSSELEAHYATHHAYVCEEKGCGCVFPDARLLELHQTECHDPLAAVCKDRGEKIFACHVATCPRHFLTPKTRRLHLIQAHGYPKEYFFAVTNKGVGGLLKRWGEGASMIRGQWKARDQVADRDDESESEDGSEEGARSEEASETDDIEKVANGSRNMIRHTSEEGPLEEGQPQANEEVDQLAGAMDSLSLVPPNIRFGRGTKKSNFGHHGPAAAVLGGRGYPRGRGGMRGAPAGSGRGAGHTPATSSEPGNVMSSGASRAGNDRQAQGALRGVLGAGNSRRGVRGFPATRAGIGLRVNANNARGAIQQVNGQEALTFVPVAVRGLGRGGRGRAGGRILGRGRGRG